MRVLKTRSGLRGESGKASESKPISGEQAPDASSSNTLATPEKPPAPPAEQPPPAPCKRNILQMPPCESRSTRAATEGQKTYNDNDYWHTIRNPSNLSPNRPDTWQHCVPTDDSDMAAVAVDSMDEPCSYREAMAHPMADGYQTAMGISLVAVLSVSIC
ncbi:hypothetical protein C8F01DRAFT_1084106 [Mycena amicta]|nr:hypothetical protein C8F01DRAFT_1084106 [Mycena amicta]